MHFTILQYLLWGGFFLLEFIGAWVLIHPDRRSLRRFCVFCMGRDVLVLLIHSSLRTYFYTYWVTEMVELCWLAELIGRICHHCVPSYKPWARWLPFIVVTSLSLTNFPPIHTAQYMLNYQGHCLLLMSYCLIISLMWRECLEQVKLILGALCLIISSLFGVLLWVKFHPPLEVWSLLWLVGLGGLITSALPSLETSDTVPTEPLIGPTRHW